MKQAHIEGDDPFKVLDDIGIENMQLFRAEREMYGDIITDIKMLFTDWLAYYPKKSITFLRHNGKGSEFKFEIDLDDEILWTGAIDAFARTPNKLNWIVEHKNHKVIPNEDERWRNLQSASYTRAVEILGWFKIDGLVWDYIRTKSPTRPQLLKSGFLSKKKIDSIPSAVKATIDEHDQDPQEYEDLLKQAQENRSNWFDRIFTPTKKDLVDKVMKDFHETAREIVSLHGKSKVKTIGRHCSWCEMEPICRAELRDLDVDHVKEREFYVEEDQEDPTDQDLQ